MSGRRAKPLYAPRIETLVPAIRVECGACGYDELISAIGLTHGLRLPPHMRVLDVVPRAALPGVRSTRQGGAFDQVG